MSHGRYLGRRKLMVVDAAEVMADRTDGHASSGLSSRGARAWNLFRTAMLYMVARFASSSKVAASSLLAGGFNNSSR